MKSKDQPKRGIWLQHIRGGKNGKWILTEVSTKTGVKTLLDTGSSVLVLRLLRKLNLEVPPIMGGPAGFEKEYVCRW